MDAAAIRSGPARLGRAGTWIVAYLLWLVLGPLGAHRFFLGRRSSGKLWLGTLGLFGFGWLADAILTASMVRDRLRSGAAGTGPLADADEGGGARGGAGGEEPGASAFHALDSFFSVIALLAAGAALMAALVHFDFVVLALPIGALWISLLLGPLRASGLASILFPVPLLPVTAERDAFERFQLGKAFRLSAAKYFAYPLYALAYPFLGKRLDGRRAEPRELALFISLHAGVLLLWLVIAASRMVSESVAAGVGLLESLLRLHPAGFAAALALGRPGVGSVARFALSSAAFIGIAGYLAQACSGLVMRSRRDTARSPGNGSAGAPAAAGWLLAAAFMAAGFAAAASPVLRERISSASGSRFAAAVEYAYRDAAIDSLIELHLSAPENGLEIYGMLEASVSLASETGRDFARSARWKAIKGSYDKVLAADLARFVPSRYRPYYRFYPVTFTDKGGARHCYLVYAVDDSRAARFLSPKREIFPLLILEASITGLDEEGKPLEGAIELGALFPAAYRSRKSSVKGGEGGGGGSAPEGAMPDGEDAPASDGDARAVPGEAPSRLEASKRLEEAIGDKLFREELAEGFRRYFIDNGMDAKGFELRLERFLERGKGR